MASVVSSSSKPISFGLPYSSLVPKSTCSRLDAWKRQIVAADWDGLFKSSPAKDSEANLEVLATLIHEVLEIGRLPLNRETNLRGAIKWMSETLVEGPSFKPSFPMKPELEYGFVVDLFAGLKQAYDDDLASMAKLFDKANLTGNLDIGFHASAVDDDFFTVRFSKLHDPDQSLKV